MDKRGSGKSKTGSREVKGTPPQETSGGEKKSPGLLRGGNRQRRPLSSFLEEGN